MTDELDLDPGLHRRARTSSNGSAGTTSRPRAAAVARELGFAAWTRRWIGSRAGNAPVRRWPRSSCPGSTSSSSTSRRTTSTPTRSTGSRTSSPAFAGGLVVVSHDRAFLDATVDRFLELDPFTRHASEFAGNWTSTWPIASGAARRRGRPTTRRWPSGRGCSVGPTRSEPSPRRGSRAPSREDEPDKHIRFAKMRGAQEHAAGAARIERRLEKIEVPDAPRRPMGAADGSRAGDARERDRDDARGRGRPPGHLPARAVRPRGLAWRAHRPRRAERGREVHRCSTRSPATSRSPAGDRSARSRA